MILQEWVFQEIWLWFFYFRHWLRYVYTTLLFHYKPDLSPTYFQIFGLSVYYFSTPQCAYSIHNPRPLPHTSSLWNFQSNKWIQPRKANTFWIEHLSFLISFCVSYINLQSRGTISESILQWKILPNCCLVLSLLSLLLIIMIYREGEETPLLESRKTKPDLILKSAKVIKSRGQGRN